MLYLKETKGKIIFDGKEINSLSTAKRKELGLEIIAEDRHKDGLVLDFSVEENSVLENYYTEKFSNRGFLKKNIISKFAKEICEKYDVLVLSDEIHQDFTYNNHKQISALALEDGKYNHRLIVANSGSKNI